MYYKKKKKCPVSNVMQLKKNVLFAFTGVVEKEIFKTTEIKSNQNITSWWSHLKVVCVYVSHSFVSNSFRPHGL